MTAMVVNMKTEGLREDFDGVFDVAVKNPRNGGNAEIVSSCERIQFTLLVCISVICFYFLTDI